MPFGSSAPQLLDRSCSVCAIQSGRRPSRTPARWRDIDRVVTCSCRVCAVHRPTWRCQHDRASESFSAADRPTSRVGVVDVMRRRDSAPATRGVEPRPDRLPRMLNSV